MIRCRPQILPQRQNVHTRSTDVVHRLLDLCITLAETQHQARLGQHIRAMPFRMLEHPQRLLVTGTWVAHGMRESLDRFDVLSKYLQSAVHDRFDVDQAALEIRRQCLDRGCGAELFDRTYAGREVGGATIGKVVPVDRCQHDILESHQLHRTCAVRRLILIEPAMRIASVHRAEAAGARTDRAHQHQCRCSRVPAFTDVRTLRFFANGREAMLLHQCTHAVELCARGHRRPEPLRFATHDERVSRSRRLDAVFDCRETLGSSVLLSATGRDDRNAFELAHV